MGFSLVVAGEGYSLVVVHGLLTAVAPVLWTTGCRMHGLQWLWLQGSVVLVHGLSCSMASGIFLDQGSNLCLLHCQADSLPLSQQGSLKELLCVQEDARGLSEARVLFPSLPRSHTHRGRLWIPDLGDSPPPLPPCWQDALNP